MTDRPIVDSPRAPLTPEEKRRRAAVLARSAEPQVARLSPSTANARPASSVYSDGFESCLRTIYGAVASKRAEVFNNMACEGLKYVRDGDLDVVAATDRLQQAAEATGLVEQFGQDTVQQWLAAANLAEADASAGIDEKRQSAETSPHHKSRRRIRQERALITRRASDVEPEPIEWVWPGRIAAGKLTLIAGKPGLGKSTVTTFIAAAVSKGDRWPCDEGRAPHGNVVLLSAEDGIADTIIPRLIGIGADRSRIEIVSGVTDTNSRKTFNLKADIDLLEAKVRSMGNVRVIIIDPISAYMGNADGNGNVETRAVLEPIAEMADRLGIAVVAVTHLNKGSVGTQNAMERFAGSIAFVAAARAGFVIVEDDENEGRLLFLQVKNNIAPKQKGLAFRLEQHLMEGGIVTSSVAWHSDHVERTADEALTAAEGRSGGERSTKDDVADFLRSLLSAGPLSVKEIEAEAVEAGLLPQEKPVSQSKAFRAARDMLGIKPRRDGGAAGAGRWVWEFPAEPKMPSQTYDAPHSGQGTLGAEGHLSPRDGQ